MKRSIFILLAASALAALSCTKEVNDQTAPEKEQVTMSFNATVGAPTKVELGAATAEGYGVMWSVGDAITVAAHDASVEDNSYTTGSEFTTDITQATASAVFEGTVDAGDAYYAVYPYNSNTRWYHQHKDFSVPFKAIQTANGLKNAILVAKAENGDLDFKHVTGFVKFTIPDTYTDIKEVRFSGNNSEVLASQYFYVYPEDLSKNTASGSTYTELTLVPSSGEVFTPGTYYFTSLPASLTKGITLTFINSEGGEAVKSTDENKPAVIKAGDILNLGTISNLNFAVAYKHTLPIEDDFSGEDVLSKYVTTGAVSVETSNLAAGGESPELMIKGGASLTVNIDLKGFSGNLTMSFNTNQKERLDITSSDGVTCTDLSSNGNTYHITVSVPEGLDVLPLTVSNNTADKNARFDNLIVTKGTIQTISFAQSSYMLTQGSNEAQSFSGQQVSGAKTTVTYASSNTSVATVNSTTGVVTLAGGIGDATITATAAASSEYRAASASYTIEVVSASVVKKEYKLTITAESFNLTSYAANNTSKTSKAVAGDGSEFEVEWTSYQVMLNSGNKTQMQWQKNKGSIYNTTNLGTIKSVTITSDAGTYKKNIGASSQPTSEGSGGFFNVLVGGATGYTTKIEVVFER